MSGEQPVGGGRPASGEEGVALLVVIAAMVVAAVLVVALIVLVRGQAGSEQDTKSAAQARTAAREGIGLYVKTLNGQLNGEEFGFRLRAQAIQRFVADQGGGPCGGAGPAVCYENNPAGYTDIVSTYIPAADRLTVRRQLGPGTYSFWQVYAISPPIYGSGSIGTPTSPGGRVVVYVRGWTGTANATGSNKAQIVRAEIRPGLFSDFELLTDGKFKAAPGLNLNGRLHSNGYNSSFNDFLSGQADMIDLGNTTSCSASARVTTRTGKIGGRGGCGAAYAEGTGELLSLLRGNSTIQWLNSNCGAFPNVTVRCVGFAPQADGYYHVSLAGSTVTVNGAGSTSVNATNSVTSYGAGGSYGAVVLIPGSVKISGKLSGAARATVIASVQGTRTSYGDTPSILIDQSGQFGATSGDQDTAFGMIADGDIVAVQGKACPLKVRGAMLALGGALSMDPDYRMLGGQIGAGVGAPALCKSGGTDFQLEGSVSGHYSPLMQVGGPGQEQGYLDRSIAYDPWLYNNPPPLFPLTAPWQVQDQADANLDCFQSAGLWSTLKDSAGCR